MTEPYRGVFPVVPTTFSESGALDLDSQRRVLDCMVDQGSDGICILANYSEQFLLSDEERATLADVCLKHIGGRVPVIVTCSHFSTQIVIERACDAATRGAAMIMLMPPYHGAALKGSEQGTYEQFARVSDAAGIPIMVQDAPLSGVNLSVPFMVKLATEIEEVRYFKIETPMAADKLRSLIAAGGDAIEGPFDGEEAITLMADLNASATGTMPSALLPDLLKPLVAAHRVNDTKEAAEQYARLLPLISFENRQCGLRACKTVFKKGGVIASDHVRHPMPQLAPETREQLLDLVAQLNPVAFRWGR